MANYPKKANDPTEAALSAIQDALNMRDSEETLEQPHPDIRFDAQSFEAVQGEPHPQLPFEDELPPFPAAVRREDALRRTRMPPEGWPGLDSGEEGTDDR